MRPPPLRCMHPMSMLCIATVALLSTMAMAQSPGQPSSEKVGASHESSAPLSTLPPIPRGKSTVMGGQIVDVDPVRDQFILKVFGGRPVKILFDERTLMYRNGKKITVLDLHPDDHASVETLLDGTKIFAVRIHMLSNLPEDEFKGQVSNYNQRTGDLTIRTDASHDLMTLNVPGGTPIVSIGQDGTSKQQHGPVTLARGTVVDVKFRGGKGGHGVATNIDVLAVPGSTFVFAGKLSSLDLHSSRLVVVDPRDDQAYPMTFDPSLLEAMSKLHEGSAVKVTTTFDGVRYIANAITTVD